MLLKNRFPTAEARRITGKTTVAHLSSGIECKSAIQRKMLRNSRDCIRICTESRPLKNTRGSELCKRRRRLRPQIPYQARLFKCWFSRDKFLDFMISLWRSLLLLRSRECLEPRLAFQPRIRAAELCNSPHVQKYVN